MVTQDALCQLKDASRNCLKVAGLFRLDATMEVLLGIIGDDPVKATEAIRNYLTLSQKTWDLWNERLTFDVVEHIERCSAGLSDPPTVSGVPYPTAHEAAGYMLSPMLQIPVMHGFDTIDELCEAASDDLELCRRVHDAMSGGCDVTNHEGIDAAIVAEWAKAERALQSAFPDSDAPREQTVRNGKTAAPTNARMLDVLTRKPECRGWTITQWTRELKCARATIQKTETWKELNAARKLIRAEHATTKRRKRAK
jgi:hypothetical protein